MRKEKKLSMRKLADRSGVSHAYISQLESGKRDAPKPELIRKLSNGLGVDYHELMLWAGYITEPDQNKEGNQKIVSVTFELNLDGIEEENSISKEELKRRFFDLHYILNNQQFTDIYYKDRLLTNEEKVKIETMLEVILNKQ
ncbi:XRE family transcriptional regulator [Jeotgalibacillus proteolyticus]|uniref:XRE family transcriptional regulator n=2 Tax=Jeotgalibacillus proteolyticus TaxID=2082395 RepID=A0A2S5GC27_9BACL|nr:XRE family transcriptional regulator [Jeotgalibacillus proteolyticus]